MWDWMGHGGFGWGIGMLVMALFWLLFRGAAGVGDPGGVGSVGGEGGTWKKGGEPARDPATAVRARRDRSGRVRGEAEGSVLTQPRSHPHGHPPLLHDHPHLPVAHHRHGL